MKNELAAAWIVYAAPHDIRPALIDDQEARSMARKLGFPVTGTLGVF